MNAWLLEECMCVIAEDSHCLYDITSSEVSYGLLIIWASIVATLNYIIQWNSSSVDTLGAWRSVLYREVSSFQALRKHIWDTAKCPQY